ncbi:hypothetical protein [Nocardioides korecus]
MEHVTDGMRDRAAEVRRLLPSGSAVTDATIVRVDDAPIGCVVVFHQSRSPWSYGVEIDLREPRSEYYYGARFPVANWREWLDTFPTNFMVDLDTGLVSASRRTQGAGYVLLHPDVRWPDPEGWDLDVAPAGPQEGAPVEPDAPLFTLEARPTSGGGPSLRATAIRAGDESTVVISVEERVDVGELLALTCLRAACHVAELRGARWVRTASSTVRAGDLGFAPTGEGHWLAARTTFLDEAFPSR